MTKLFAAFTCAFLIGSGSAMAQATIKVSSFTPPRAHTVDSVFIPWMKDIERDSGGALKAQGFWGGSLGRDPAQALKLLLDGVADVSFIVPAYTAGRFPESNVFNLPYLVNSSEESSTTYWRALQKGVMSGFDGMKVIAVWTTPMSSFHTNKPAKTLDDLKGMKLAGAGKTRVDLVKMIGATTVAIPVSKVAESVARGVLDGGLLDWAALYSFQVVKTTPYHLMANLGCTPLFAAMNTAAYERLPAAAKAAIDKNSGEMLSRYAGKEMDRLDSENEARTRKLPEHQFTIPTEQQKREWTQRFLPLHEDWKQEIADGARKYQVVTQIIADFRAGK